LIDNVAAGDHHGDLLLDGRVDDSFPGTRRATTR
jgi:hypothetical protein